MLSGRYLSTDSKPTSHGQHLLSIG